MKKIFEALSDDSRIKILELLKHKELSAGEIHSHFNFSKPTLSHHLNILKNAGFINSEKRGQFTFYSVELTVFDEILIFIKKIKGR